MPMKSLCYTALKSFIIATIAGISNSSPKIMWHFFAFQIEKTSDSNMQTKYLEYVLDFTIFNQINTFIGVLNYILPTFQNVKIYYWKR